MAAKPASRWLIVSAAAAAVVAAIALMLAPRPVDVDAAAVARGPIADTVYDQGEARVQDAYVAAAPVRGRLQRIQLKVGDRVTRGQVVARITPAAPALLDPSARAQRVALVAWAEAEVDRTQAEKVRTAQVLDRVRPLAAMDAVSRQSLDDATAAARQAAAAALAAEHVLGAVRAALIEPDGLGGTESGAAVAVIVPVPGAVTRVPEPSERTVDVGAPLVEISDDRELEAVIEFLSQDAARIRVGMAAEVYDWGGPTVLHAVVRRIEPQGFTKTSALGVEEQRALVWLRFTDPPGQWSTLGPGYRVWGRVFLRREVNALKIPLGALQRNAGGWAVFRIEGRRARLRPIVVGALDDHEAEVISGLSVGDRVAVYPSDTVRDGVAVRVRSP